MGIDETIIERLQGLTDLHAKLLGRVSMLSSACSLLVRQAGSRPADRARVAEALRQSADFHLEGTDDRPSPEYSRGVTLQLNELLAQLERPESQ